MTHAYLGYGSCGDCDWETCLRRDCFSVMDLSALSNAWKNLWTRFCKVSPWGKKFVLHFISGLPRSDSKLLSALLSQNPRFRVNMSSPVAVLLENMSDRNKPSVFIDNDTWWRIIRSVIAAYCADTSAKVVLDTNRAWCTRMPLLKALFPQSKVVAYLRDMPWIIDIIERLVRRNIFNYPLFLAI